MLLCCEVLRFITGFVYGPQLFHFSDRRWRQITIGREGVGKLRPVPTSMFTSHRMNTYFNCYIIHSSQVYQMLENQFCFSFQCSNNVDMVMHHIVIVTHHVVVIHHFIMHPKFLCFEIIHPNICLYFPCVYLHI